ncbi:putative bifunctional diguanylate cyclase/phosphodiesterase [Hyphomicrobium sp.]|jgi:diguanylate cyclase (GGDEF)-like protein|uniref:putative bifunctional diguanylate cyclase/phosphodiesterase n=1 Tax=Hyphomicrobium sp. TaxID=82 RepID=UPI003564187C
MPFTRFRSERRANKEAINDAVILLIICVVVWVLIERTETCTRFFQYVAAHPDMELDSVVLAGIFSAIGLLIFALRRWAEAARSEQRYNKLAHRDALTGLSNRLSFMEALDNAVGRGTKYPFACLLFDLDSFKQVNDLRGHFVGDKLLEEVTQRLSSVLPPGALLARMGGDEFAMLFSLDTPHRVTQVAGLVMRLVSEPQMLEGQVVQVGVSVGVARYPDDADQPDALLRRADIALYRAKTRQHSIQLFEPSMEDADHRYALVAATLRDAIPRREIVPNYQPLVELGTGEVIGYEVLARWTNSPVLGSVAASEFIPAASQAGLIDKLSRHLLEQACSEAVRWPRPLRISFNLTPRQLCDPLLPMQILAVLTKTGFSPRRLDIEMTEDALLENADTARVNLQMLKDQGVTLTLDDFGTGYSSLHHLRMLPFDKVKIDRSYVGKMVSCDKSRLMVDAIIKLVHAVELPVLAEGVETEFQAQILKELGCDFAQGWLYGKAMPNVDVHRALIRTKRGAHSAALIA